MADQEFVNFESALNELKLSEDALKRLVSEGEIRAIRGENNTMKFRKEEIERLKQDTGKTIQYTEESSDTLTDDLLFDEADDLDVDEEGMATAQISSEDTFVGDDTGMTTAPLAASTPAPQTKVGAVRKSTGGRSTTSTVRRTTGRSTRMRMSAMEQEASGIGAGVTAMLVITFVVCAFGMLVWWDIAKDQFSSPTSGISSWAGQNFGGIEGKGE